MKYVCAMGAVRFCALIAVVMFSSGVRADDARPLYVEISEQAGNGEAWIYDLKWRLPPALPIRHAPEVQLPEGCRALTPSNRSSSRPIQRHRYACQNSLSGHVIRLQFPGYNPGVSSLIKLKTLAGEQHTALLGPQESRWHVPSAETKAQIAADYFQLGIQHIWAGTDHLLFVLCLLWIAGGLRRILVTITGFTVAHSITLAFSALQIIRIPVPPVGAVIALSIVFLAVEIAKNRKDSLTWRYPVAVSSSFGLLHGLGFAAELAEIGLPQTEVLTGLLFFNIGVEIGQVVFAILAVAILALIRRATTRWRNGLRVERAASAVASYGIGGIASFWLVERCMAFLPGTF